MVRTLVRRGRDHIQVRGVEAADAQLLGRKTYEGFAATWPTMEDTGDFGVKMNTMPKFVVSSTLKNPTWTNTTLISGDVAKAVRELKQKPGGDLLLAVRRRPSAQTLAIGGSSTWST